VKLSQTRGVFGGHLLELRQLVDVSSLQVFLKDHEKSEREQPFLHRMLLLPSYGKQWYKAYRIGIDCVEE
jgi:hypothetical protein